ncbi:hypothetical protein L1887_19072 [Cichorium endivia]|nr:hypothetical protein L1887_19072 [Cichorium endivia]
MGMTIAKTTTKMMMLFLLVLYLINDLHASTNRSLHLEAKSGLVYVDRRGGGGGSGGGGRGFGGGGRGFGGGGRGFGGGGRGSGGGKGGHVGGEGEGEGARGGNRKGGSRGGSDDEHDFTPGHVAGGYHAPVNGRRSNNGSLHSGSFLQLASTMLGIVILSCFP